VKRHAEILRDLAHEISPAQDRPDRPANASEAEARLTAYIAKLEASTLGTSSEDFVNHVATLARRYASHLFVCFDDERIPPTTNELEGFFGAVKRYLRKATGNASTANGLAQNLGPELLVAFPEARRLIHDLEIDPEAFANARANIDEVEQPIRLRRSYVRHLELNLGRLLGRWKGLD
jgi:hypothetical protein